jgi:hypothetical protein
MGEGDKDRRKTILLVALMVIILIAAWLLIPNIPGLIEPEEGDEPIYEQYDVFETENFTAYRNQKLNVSIKQYNTALVNSSAYEAEWLSIAGNISYTKGNSLDELYNNILGRIVSLTNDQIKWYEFMLKDELK